MTVEYTVDIRDTILSYLDGWVVYSQNPTSNIVNSGNTNNENVTNENNNVEPFITDITTYQGNPNKKITDEELQTFFENSFDKSLMICNRHNIDDLTQAETNFYIKGVCLLTASDIWNKYNIRVNNEDMEDTYVQSYGGLLYKQSMTILKNFINQRITGLHNFRNKEATNLNNNWIF